MLLMPRRDLDLWEDIFDEPFFSHHNSNIMKTDIKEKGDKYLLVIDLPGVEKENIKIELENEYLTVSAKNSSQTEEKEDGKFLRRERYYGESSRSFYVGENLTEEDIKASFKNGVLELEVPKVDETRKIPEKKYIQIED